MTPAKRLDVREAETILAPFGATLAQAAKFYAEQMRSAVRLQCDLGVLAFLKEIDRRGSRAATFQWYSSKLDPFVKKFGKKMLDEIGRAEIRAWVDTLKAGPSGRRHHAKAVRSLFRWAVAHDPQYVAMDPTAGLVARPDRREKKIEFLTVAECRRVLDNAGKYRSAIALGLFAGIRPEEIAGDMKPKMTWASVNTVEKFVRVDAAVAKTRKPRLLEDLPPTLWHWLTPGDDDDDDPICPSQGTHIATYAQRCGKLKRWPSDALRTTFATYAVAKLGDAGIVANWLGHEGSLTMLYNHYRGIATKAEAEKFWELRPTP